MTNLRFICPDCNGNELVEILTGATYYVVLTPGGDYAKTGTSDVVHGGDVARHECAGCGWGIKANGGVDNIVEWLLDQPCNQDAGHPCPNRCPGCGKSGSISWGNVNIVDLAANQDGFCHACGAKWTDYYDAARRRVYRKPKGEIAND